MLQDFKKFILKGNILDLAVAVIIGAAFNKIVSSFVNDIIMPPIGVLVGGVDFSDLAFTIKEATQEAVAVTMNYGKFIQSIIDFVIIGFTIFMVVKSYNAVQKKKEEAPVPPPAPTKEEILLTEIRDAIRESGKVK